MPEPVRSLPILPQIVPSQTCVTCEVCCRFPERDSFLRPYFTPQEIARAVARGVDESRFPHPDGCQVEVAPHPDGEGFLCPAFDPITSRCTIYEDRPLDCQLYPFALMWDAQRQHVVLGWDAKCPYMGDVASAKMTAAADGLAGLLESDDTVGTLAEHPRLIGRYQDDVVIVRRLERVTRALRHDVEGVFLRPLTVDDRPRIQAAIVSARPALPVPLAAFSFASHYLWHSILDYSWAEIAGHLCLFASSSDGMFMVLPPLGPGLLHQPLHQAMRYMRIRNGGSTVSRIENVPAEYHDEIAGLGYRLTPTGADYIYRVDDLISLSGDRYKSQRAACNRFEREHDTTACDPYRAEDRDACLAMHGLWRAQKESAGLNEWERLLLNDSSVAHNAVLNEHQSMGLLGVTVKIAGTVRAYTFGMWLKPDVFCIVLEVADRTVSGLAQYVFRECCRVVKEQGARFINTMDDCQLPRLANSKRLYHPVATRPNFTLTES